MLNLIIEKLKIGEKKYKKKQNSKIIQFQKKLLKILKNKTKKI